MEASLNTSYAGFAGIARRTLGICLLLVVVFLWTASNFLASTIFADNTYSKPFFVTYINTSTFILPLFTIIFSRLWRLFRAGKLYQVRSLASLLRQLDSQYLDAESERILDYDTVAAGQPGDPETWNSAGLDGTARTEESEKLGLKETAKLSFGFCFLWFLANYLSVACLQYTTVGSTTILTSTSGVWTLLLGATIGVERFTVRKLAGVIASLLGIILISRVDLSAPGSSATNPTDVSSSGSGGGSTFPSKTAGEIALGNLMAASSAVMYGIYTVVLKRRVGDESRVNMQLFFGLVGFFNVFLLWPGFILIHVSGVEPFALPETGRIWTIISINALASLLSDICWAYAMLLMTPLVVTVGLSLTIPLSLVGQIILQGYYATPLYWVGATVVFLSFLIVNHESAGDIDNTTAPAGREGDGVGGGGGRYRVLVDQEAG